MEFINFKKRNLPGFTLIELLLYIGLSAAMLLMIFIFLSFLLQTRVKSQVLAEVEQQGIQAMELMTQTARNATKINLPAKGNEGSLLNLTIVDPSKNPTIFDLDQGAIRITEGSIVPTHLTNSRVIVSDLIFQNLSRDDLPAVIRIQFTLSYVNLLNKNEYQYSKTFYNTANLRVMPTP